MKQPVSLAYRGKKVKEITFLPNNFLYLLYTRKTVYTENGDQGRHYYTFIFNTRTVNMIHVRARDFIKQAHYIPTESLLMI